MKVGGRQPLPSPASCWQAPQKHGEGSGLTAFCAPMCLGARRVELAAAQAAHKQAVAAEAAAKAQGAALQKELAFYQSSTTSALQERDKATFQVEELRPQVRGSSRRGSSRGGSIRHGSSRHGQSDLGQPIMLCKGYLLGPVPSLHVDILPHSAFPLAC